MTLRSVCQLLGGWLAAVGVGQIILGTKAIPGAGPSDAAIDSQTRAAGVLAVAVGVTQISAVRTRSSHTMRALAAVSATLAGARLAAIPTRGRPSGLVPVAIVTEASTAALLLACAAQD